MNGYLALGPLEGTLNSKYYGRFHRSIPNLEGPLNFPQRVPRADFFEELVEIGGGSRISTRFRKLVDPHRKRCAALLRRKAPLQDREAWELINRAKLLLRYASFDHICNWRLPSTQNPNLKIELKLVREQARIYRDLSKGKSPPLGGLAAISKIALRNRSVSDSTLVYCAGRYLVAKFRYKFRAKAEPFDRHLARALERSLAAMDAPDSFSIIRRAVGYRALAMVPSYSIAQRGVFLSSMSRINCSLEATRAGNLDYLCILENSYTSSQTLAKWEQQRGRNLMVVMRLNQMIKIDPKDSVGHSELGLHHYNSDEPIKAAKYFRRAAQLGPPAVGMNWYYFGLCELAAGRNQSAIKAFGKAISTDPHGISAWLELFDLAGQQNQNKKQKGIARHLLAKPGLRGQLDENEIFSLSKCL